MLTFVVLCIFVVVVEQGALKTKRKQK